MMPRALVVFLFLGCASAQDTAPLSEDIPADRDTTLGQDDACVYRATVTVRVENQSSFDIQVRFGSYRPARVAEGFSRTTYQVARAYLQGAVRLDILRGGMQLGGPAVIQTEPVFCSTATLVIGARPEYSVFYGDALREPIVGGDDGEEVEAAEEAPAEAAEQAPAEPAPADSTSSEVEG
jgi:hypothetical protein